MIHVRKLEEQDLPGAMELVWAVFQRFEAPEYSAQGVETFQAYIQNMEQVKTLVTYGAYTDGRLAGVLALRGDHISLFFVREEAQGRGIGRALFQYAAARAGRPMTVHSSPYAVEIYRRLGFVPTAEEQVEDGIRYTPMRLE